jgi:hypothetical protein
MEVGRGEEVGTGSHRKYPCDRLSANVVRSKPVKSSPAVIVISRSHSIAIALPNLSLSMASERQ